MSERDKLPRWVFWLGLAFAGTWLLYTLRGVLAPVFFAFLIAYMLDPLVDRIEQSRLLRGRSYGRAVGIAVILASFFVITAIGVLVVVPMVYEQVASFLRRLPALVAGTREDIEPWLAQYGLEIPTSVAHAFEQLHLDAQSVLAKGYGPFVAAMKSFLGGTATAVAGIVASLMIPVFAFYLLYDFDRLVASVGNLIPPHLREEANGFFSEIDAVLGQFFRGQFTVMAILGILYALGYGLVGVPLALPIGITAGFLAFIPYLGSFTALGLALLMTFLEWQGWPRLFWVVGVHFVIQGAEGFIITPKIMGDNVGISSIAVLLALLVGAELLGFTGVLLAVPTAAVLKVLFQRLDARYRASSFYTGNGNAITGEASRD